MCSVYLGEFICILDPIIMIYNTYLLHVYIDNTCFYILFRVKLKV